MHCTRSNILLRPAKAASTMKPCFAIVTLAFAASSFTCGGTTFEHPAGSGLNSHVFERPLAANLRPDAVRLIIESAHEQLKVTTKYTQDYRVIPYPNGDLPEDTGACTDVVIRAFRKA